MIYLKQDLFLSQLLLFDWRQVKIGIVQLDIFSCIHLGYSAGVEHCV